jgi:hypothetical protein
VHHFRELCDGDGHVMDDLKVVLHVVGCCIAGQSGDPGLERVPLGAAHDNDAYYIGGVTPSRPTFTRGACSVPSGCFVAAVMKIFAPGFSSVLSPDT